MEYKNGGESPKFTFCDNDARPKVERSKATSKFRPGDKVYFRVPGTQRLEGPYIIESVPRVQIYTLCLENGQTVNDGNEVEEKDLVEPDRV